MMRVVLLLGHSWIVVATMIALVAVGFAHRTGQPPLTPELSAYVAAGGSLSDLCGMAGEPGDAPLQTCDACRIADTFAQPTQTSTTTSIELAKIYAFDFVAKRLAESGRLDTARLVRAPPQA